MTVDDTWIHHYTPEMNVQSKLWISPGETTPKRTKAVRSTGTGHHFLEFARHNLHRLFGERKDNHPFHYDNAHLSEMATEKLDELVQ